MNYFKAWVSKNHPQIIENYPTDNSITLWEQCCRYHKEVIKEYRLDVDAIKTIEHERDNLRRALEKACEYITRRLSDDATIGYAKACPWGEEGWTKEKKCYSECLFMDGAEKECWLLYFMEE